MPRQLESPCSLDDNDGKSDWMGDAAALITIMEQLPFIYIPFAILDIHLDIYLDIYIDIPLANQTLDDDNGESDGGRVMLLHRYLNGTSRNLIASCLST